MLRKLRLLPLVAAGQHNLETPLQMRPARLN
jgi:hypothetical protein